MFFVAIIKDNQIIEQTFFKNKNSARRFFEDLALEYGGLKPLKHHYLVSLHFINTTIQYGTINEPFV